MLARVLVLLACAGLLRAAPLNCVGEEAFAIVPVNYNTAISVPDNWDGVTPYTAGIRCSWTITSTDQVFRVHIEQINLGGTDTVSIYSGDGFNTLLRTFDASSSAAHGGLGDVLSTTPQVRINFTSDATSPPGTGVEISIYAEYNATYCTDKGELTAASGVLLSQTPYIGSTYYAAQGPCAWSITVAPTAFASLWFTALNVAPGDFITVYDGNSDSSPVLLTAVGNSLPRTPVNSTFNQLYVVFSGANADGVHHGFTAAYAAVERRVACAMNVSSQANSTAVNVTLALNEQVVLCAPCPYASQTTTSKDQVYEWHLLAPAGQTLELYFVAQEATPGQHFFIYSGGSLDPAAEFDDWIGAAPLQVVRAYGSELLLHFEEDSYNAPGSFVILVKAVAAAQCAPFRFFDADHGSFSAPSPFGRGVRYAANLYCGFRIHAPIGRRISFTVSASNVSASDFLLAFDGSDASFVTLAGGRGNALASLGQVNSTTNEVYVLFKTGVGPRGLGFNIEYETFLPTLNACPDLCQGPDNVTTLSIVNGSLSVAFPCPFTGAPGGIPVNVTCRFVVTAPAGMNVQVRTNVQDLSPGMAMRLYDGAHDTGGVVGGVLLGYWGPGYPPDADYAYSTGNAVAVRFTTGADAGDGIGFMFTFDVVQPVATACHAQTQIDQDLLGGSFASHEPYAGRFRPRAATFCSWVIVAPALNYGYVRVSITDIDLGPGDKLTLYAGADNTPYSSSYYGVIQNITAPGDYYVRSSAAYIEYFTGNEPGTGFNALWGLYDPGLLCPQYIQQTATQSPQVVYVPERLVWNQYAPRMDCYWSITPDSGDLVTLVVMSADIGAGDALSVYDRNTAELLYTIGPGTLQQAFKISGSGFDVVFCSDDYEQGAGFSFFAMSGNTSVTDCLTPASVGPTNFDDHEVAILALPCPYGGTTPMPRTRSWWYTSDSEDSYVTYTYQFLYRYMADYDRVVVSSRESSTTYTSTTYDLEGTLHQTTANIDIYFYPTSDAPPSNTTYGIIMAVSRTREVPPLTTGSSSSLGTTGTATAAAVVDETQKASNFLPLFLGLFFAIVVILFIIVIIVGFRIRNRLVHPAGAQPDGRATRPNSDGPASPRSGAAQLHRSDSSTSNTSRGSNDIAMTELGPRPQPSPIDMEPPPYASTRRAASPSAQPPDAPPSYRSVAPCERCGAARGAGVFCSSCGARF